MKTNSSSMAVMSPPRLAGDKNPRTANTMVTTPMPISCIPVPTYTDSREALVGALNTSPCTCKPFCYNQKCANGKVSQLSDACCKQNITFITFTAVSCHASVLRLQKPTALCMCLQKVSCHCVRCHCTYDAFSLSHAAHHAQLTSFQPVSSCASSTVSS